MSTQHHKSKHSGLSDQQILESRAQHGENSLTPPQKTPLWKLLVEKFADPIIRILLVALVLSFAMAIYEFVTHEPSFEVFFEPIGILIAVLLATCVGFMFERNAAKKFEVLCQVNDETSVRVIRNGLICEVPKLEIVVGDIVLLETGEEVPADGVLLESVSLQINESTLTGEPIVKKTTLPEDFDEEATYPSNTVMRGTSVLDGHAVIRITAVGDHTEYGKVYEGSQIENKIKTPLNLQLESLSKWITVASYTIAALIIIGRLSQYFFSVEVIDWWSAGSYMLNTLMIAITVIVVAVPEGLPMSVTLSLALSMRRMLKTQNLVRKMHACETMGATTVICSDKTGTLTQNQMQVAHCQIPAWKGDLHDHSPISNLIINSIAINSTANLDFSSQPAKTLGNPTEGALLHWLQKNDVPYLQYREEGIVEEQLTFSTERKYMATVIQLEHKRVLLIKGAPEIILEKCKTLLTESGAQDIAIHRQSLLEHLSAAQNKALRTIAIAYLELEKEGSVIVDGKIANLDLCWIGLFAIADPIRKEVPQAIQSCMDAGIDIKILTGDTSATAIEIGRQVGLWTPQCTTKNHIVGSDFGALSDTEVAAILSDIKIMSRARPMDKERLVRLLQQRGDVVAVTGDGTNDAPALNMAQVGLSMGDGTTVAKEASDITIMDNSFNSISQAVLWGRSLYQNIQRFILFQLTINVVACLIVLIGAFLGTESPLNVSQMLWVNLIMDTFAALALASLPPEAALMKRNPRRTQDHIINLKMRKQILITGLFFVVLLLGILQYFKNEEVVALCQWDWSRFFHHLFHFSSPSGSLSIYELSVFFSFFVLFQFWNMFNAKVFGSNASIFGAGRKGSGSFLWVALGILVGQILIVQFAGPLFQVCPLPLLDWIIIICFSSIILLIGEVARFFARKFRKSLAN